MDTNLMRVTTTYVVCPHCQKNSGCTLDHLIEKRIRTNWGPWYCKECGCGFTGTVSEIGKVAVEKYAGSFTRQLNLLCIPPQDKPIYLVTSDRHPTDREWEGTRYYYEEHSCPTNWLKCIELISINGDQDPHGLIRYIASVKHDPAKTDDTNYDWSETFPQIAVEALGRKR